MVSSELLVLRGYREGKCHLCSKGVFSTIASTLSAIFATSSLGYLGLNFDMLINVRPGPQRWLFHNLGYRDVKHEIEADMEFLLFLFLFMVILQHNT